MSLQALVPNSARSFRAGLAGLIAAALAYLHPTASSAATFSTEQVIASWAKPGAHPLIGRIWTARDGRVVDGIAISRGIITGSPVADALGIRHATYVLLGEVHDNGEHHLLRAGLIEDMTQRTAFGPMAYPAIVAEHVDDGHAARLLTINQGIARGEATSDSVLEALSWDKSGWPAAALFRPLFAVIAEARLKLYAGNVPRAEIRELVRNGPAAIPDERRVNFGLERALPPPLNATLSEELKGSHCGMLPESAIGGMAAAQRYRDGRMAAALIEAAAGPAQAILLAGNGHVRTDRGVPWHIRAATPQAQIVAVMLTEVEDGKVDLLAYIPRDPDGRPTADVVIFTPRTAREDPCEKMRQHMQNRKG